MDMIKVECEIDPLAIEDSNHTDVEEQKPLSEEGNVLDLQVTGIKTECVDHSYDVKTEKTVDETAVLIDFPVVKSEVEEGNVLDLHRTEIKAECVNQRYDMKPEITFVEIPVPIDCSIVKNEVQAELHKTDGGSFKRKLDVDRQRLIAKLHHNFTPLCNPCDSDGHYQVIEDVDADLVSYVKSVKTYFDGSLPVMSVEEVQTESHKEVVAHETILSPSQSPSVNIPETIATAVLQQMQTTVTNRPTSRQHKRNRMEDYTSSKVDFNDLRCRLLLEKHSMEMKILKTNLEVARVELEIKKAILANKLKK
ncbi:uncharacterized protein [Periplaneta americana]|uniref:uncharacterized protein isoform X7 n=1 Tax=Periplaneta americana TaxID=6978 RepID=UPI0037E7DD96